MKIELDSVIDILDKEINLLNKNRIKYLAQGKDCKFSINKVLILNEIKNYILSNLNPTQMSIKSPCGKKLASGQWWGFCGETDMGQSVPAKCTNCGGDFILQEDVDKFKKEDSE